jgi:hypothetical protein
MVSIRVPGYGSILLPGPNFALVRRGSKYYILTVQYGRYKCNAIMKFLRLVRYLSPLVFLLIFAGAASAQLVDKFDKQPEKTQKQTLVQGFGNDTANSMMVVDFNAELKTSSAEVMPTATKIQPLPATFCTTGNLAIDSLVRSEARDHNVDPCLIMLVMGAESTYKQNAISPKGAMGLMQLIPETAARFGVKDVFNAKENIHGGAAYLRWLLDYFNNDVPLALAGYNAGEGAVVKYHNTIPPYDETQKYVRIIWGQYVRIYASQTATAKRPVLMNGSAQSPSFKIVVDFDALQEGHPTEKQ